MATETESFNIPLGSVDKLKEAIAKLGFMSTAISAIAEDNEIYTGAVSIFHDIEITLRSIYDSIEN